MEELLFDFKVLWHFQFVVVLVKSNQELFDDGRWRWKANKFQKSAQTLVYFLRECSNVLDNAKVRMADPSVDKPFIKGYGFWDVFISGFVINTRVECLSSVSCSNHMDDCLIPSISQVNSAPSSFIQYRLPNILITVSRSVHNTSIAQDNSGCLT